MECPNCGQTEISLWRRSTAVGYGRNTFKCRSCGKWYHIPGWCITVELVFAFTCAGVALKLCISCSDTTSLIVGGIVAYLMIFISGAIISLFVPMKPDIHDFDYGDYSMVSRHKGNNDNENKNEEQKQ